jgi:transposase
MAEIQRASGPTRHGAKALLAQLFPLLSIVPLGGRLRFARTVRRDVDAVGNALTEDWSKGQTERQINRLKTLKRAMLGRASTELLRARMLPNYLPGDHRV